MNHKRIENIFIQPFQFPSEDFVLRFEDRDGYIVPKEEAMEVIELLLKFYSSKDVESKIEKTNTKIRIEFLALERWYSFREFRKNLKKHWSFKCDWCQEKISSSDGREGYYYFDYLNSPEYEGNRCCSKECAKHLEKEAKNEYLKTLNI